MKEEPEAEYTFDPDRTKAAIERIREIRSRVQPDPEGWIIRDYIDYGRR